LRHANRSPTCNRSRSAAWTDYERTKLTTGEAGFEAAAKSDAVVMQAALTADVQLSAMKVQVYGSLSYRVITLVAGLPPAVHFGLVYIDTILASKAFLGTAYFGVPKLPTPYDTFEWAGGIELFSCPCGQSWQVKRCLLAWRKEINGSVECARVRTDIERTCAGVTERPK
jgi:hypothetical protein